MEIDEYAQAISDFDAALRLNPSFMEALADRGVAHARLGNLAQALADFTASINLRPGSHNYYNRGAIYLRLNNFRAAISDFDEALRLNPNVDIARAERGLAYGALREHQQAVVDLRSAVQTSPTPRAWSALCWNLAAIEELTEALSACDVALQLNPAGTWALSSRGFINLKLRRFRQALADFDAARRTAEVQDPRNLFGRGMAALGLGRNAEGRADIAAAAAEDPTVAAWYSQYGLTVDPQALVSIPIDVTPVVAAATAARLRPTNRGSRVALVIGVGGYETLRNLVNPTNDARIMATALRNVGFDVDLVLDPDIRTMERAIMRLGERMSAAGSNATGLFFFAGHGMQSRGINYLIPARPQIRREADLTIEAVSADAVLLQMQESVVSTNILILDACRDMPLTRSFRSGSRGLAEMRAPLGSFIAYSTAPGAVAADGEGLPNSPYVSALVTEMQQPGQSLADTFIAVRRAVIAATGGEQTPWESTSMIDHFYFVEVPERAQ